MPDGKRIVTASDSGRIQIWDLSGNLAHFWLADDDKRRVDFAIAPNGDRVVTWSGDGPAVVWGLPAGEKGATISGSDSKYAIWSPDSRLIALIDADGDITVCEGESGRELARFAVRINFPYCLSFNQDSTLLAANVGTDVIIWNVCSGNEVRRISDGTGNVRQLAFVKDGTDLVVQSRWEGNTETRENDHPETTTVWQIDRLDPTWRFKGRADVDALASKKPFPVFCHDKSLVAYSVESGTVVGELPVSLTHVQTHLSGRRWAGAMQTHLCIFCLEGTEQQPIEASTVSWSAGLTAISNAQLRQIESTEENVGWSWHADDYVTHEAICPACGCGCVFGSGKYRTSLRVYFEEGEARSLKRNIVRMRIKCGGPRANEVDGSSENCTTGTGDEGTGLVLLPYQPGGWLREKVRGYLFSIGSPLVSHRSLETLPSDHKTAIAARELR